MRSLIILMVLMLSCQSKDSSTTVNRMSHEEIIQKYVYDGAWKVGDMYSQEWQDKLDEGLLIDPTVAYLWQQKAMPLYKQMKFDLATKYINRAVEHNPEKWQEYRAFMTCIFVRDYKAAIKDFETCIEKYGNQYVMDHSYSFYIAISSIQLNDYVRAKDLLEKEIAGEEEEWVHFLDHFYLGIAHYELKEYDNAIASFDLALSAYPQFSDAMYYKAKAILKLGNWNEGIALIKEAFKFKDYTINEDNTLHERFPYQVNWKAKEIELSQIL